MGYVIFKGARGSNKTLMSAHVLELMFKKKVNIDILNQTKDVETYNRCIHYTDRQLTEDEYKLLKEIYDYVNDSD